MLSESVSLNQSSNYLTAMSSCMNCLACSIEPSWPRIVTPVNPLSPGSRSNKMGQETGDSYINDSRVKRFFWFFKFLFGSQYEKKPENLTDFDMNIEIVLDFADFAATTTNDHANFFRVNVHFAWCTGWIEIVVGSWCTTVIEVYSRLTIAIIIESASAILTKTTLVVTVAVCIVAWTLSYVWLI